MFECKHLMFLWSRNLWSNYRHNTLTSLFNWPKRNRIETFLFFVALRFFSMAMQGEIGYKSGLEWYFTILNELLAFDLLFEASNRTNVWVREKRIVYNVTMQSSHKNLATYRSECWKINAFANIICHVLLSYEFIELCKKIEKSFRINQAHLKLENPTEMFSRVKIYANLCEGISRTLM